MKYRKYIGTTIAGIAAGAVNGLFGAGGGMVLVPLLTMLTKLEDDAIFPASVSIILPICFVSLGLTIDPSVQLFKTFLPYLIGSILGGVLAGIWGRKISTSFLHKLLGILILWGGIRYLC